MSTPRPHQPKTIKELRKEILRRLALADSLLTSPLDGKKALENAKVISKIMTYSEILKLLRRMK